MELFVLCNVLEGLDYAHRLTDYAGNPLHIVHRDMSPPNVLLTRHGEVKIVGAELRIMESYPIQVMLDVSGEKPTPCHEVFWTAEDDGEVIHIEMISQVASDQDCAQVTEPFIQPLWHQSWVFLLAILGYAYVFGILLTLAGLVLGVVETVRGVDAFADIGPYEGPEEPVYSVAFASSDLFGPSDEGEWTVLLDLFESYLEPA